MEEAVQEGRSQGMTGDESSSRDQGPKPVQPPRRKSILKTAVPLAKAPNRAAVNQVRSISPYLPSSHQKL